MSAFLLKEKLISSLKQSRVISDSVSSVEDLVSENLLSQYILRLPSDIKRQASEAVQALFQVRCSEKYQQELQDTYNSYGVIRPKNNAICMSYDFHVDENQKLKLIEINTNAAFLALSEHLYQVQGLKNPYGFSPAELKKSIENELRLQGQDVKPNLKIAILDENPQEQRLYVEFLVYHQMFKSWGWDSKICNITEDLSEFDFIYNRYTDFFLSEDKSKNLKTLFNQGKTFSPHPYEYFLLADKERLLQLTDLNFLSACGVDEKTRSTLDQHILKSGIVTSENQNEVWAQRKLLFFKPRQGFGSKQTYKGISMSRKMFDEAVTSKFLYQQFCAPSEVDVQTPDGPQKMKYDLRFYAYQGKIQSVVGRLYQGQVTNLRTPYGGFAAVEFE